MKRLPVLPLRDQVWFPGDFGPLFVGRSETLAAVASAQSRSNEMAFVALRDPDRAPDVDNLFRIGVVGVLVQVREEQPGVVRIMAEAKKRIRLGKVTQAKERYLEAQITELNDPIGSSKTLPKVIDRALVSFDSLRIRLGLPKETSELLKVAFKRKRPTGLPAAALRNLALGTETHWISVQDRQALLEADSWSERIKKMTQLFDTALALSASPENRKPRRSGAFARAP